MEQFPLMCQNDANGDHNLRNIGRNSQTTPSSAAPVPFL